jgi:hypothetical protein
MAHSPFSVEGVRKGAEGGSEVVEQAVTTPADSLSNGGQRQ